MDLSTGTGVPATRYQLSHEAGLRLMRGLVAAEPITPTLTDTNLGQKQPRILRVGNDVTLPQLERKPIFVRYFYDQCIEGAMSNLDSAGTLGVRRFLILGSAGIGKSAFGLVLLRHALRQRPARTVVYVNDRTLDAYVFRARGSGGGHDVTPFLKENLPHDIDDSRTVLICDSLCPPTVAAFTVMISSPSRKRYKNFWNSQPCNKLVFPPFSWPEIRAMRDTCFPSVSDEDLMQKYNLIGGIPRFVFWYSRHELNYDIDWSLAFVGLDAIAAEASVAEIEDDTLRSDTVMRMIPRGTAGSAESAGLSPCEQEFYAPARVELASREVVRRTFVATVWRDRARLYTRMAESLASGYFARFYADLFEPAAVDLLRQGGTFKWLDLQIRSTGELTIPPATAVEYFDDPGDLRRQFEPAEECLYASRNRNVTAVDAVLPGGLLANVTINLRCESLVSAHGARSIEGVLQAAAALRDGVDDGKEVTLYWFMPMERFDDLRRTLGSGSPSLLDLVVAEEQDAIDKEKHLRVDLEQAQKSLGSAASPEGAAVVQAAGERLRKHQEAISEKALAWTNLKQRVKVFAVQLQLQQHTRAVTSSSSSKSI